MTEPARRKWEYATIPLLIHNTKAILDSWGVEGWELVPVLPGPGGSDQLVAYLKRPSWDLRARGGPACRAREAPPPRPPCAPPVRTGSLEFTSGQLPFVDGGLRRPGKVGGSV